MQLEKLFLYLIAQDQNWQTALIGHVVLNFKLLFRTCAGECTVPVSQLLGRRTRKLHGAEALLHKQAKEKRANFGARHQNMSHLRCTYSLNGNRCTDRILPLTKYCLRRILTSSCGKKVYFMSSLYDHLTKVSRNELFVCEKIMYRVCKLLGKPGFPGILGF